MKNVLLLALAIAGCGGGRTLSLTFPDNQPDDLAAVMERLASAPAPDRAVAVGITPEPHRLFAYDLSAQRRVWEHPIESPRTAPELAGDLVVLHEGARVVGRRVSDGQIAFALADENLSLVGAGGEGSLAAFVLSTTGGVGARSRLYVVRGGGIASRVDFDGPVGAPDVRAGMVFVPWASQNVSVIDGASGEEIARLRFLDGVVGHARATPAGVFFGQRGVGRVSASASIARESVGWFEPDTAELPGRPDLWRNAYDPPSSADSATHSIQLAWAPAAGDGPVRAADGTLYLTFYKLVFGLAQDDLSVRWVYQHPTDLVGAAARAGGVLLADREGGLTFLDASGRPRWGAEIGLGASAVSMRVDGFEPSGDEGPALPPLYDQLLAAVQSTDARLVPGRAFAVRAMAALPDEAVTEHIIVLCDDRGLPADVRRAACDALATRNLGADAVLAALERHASFLAETTAPPVGALASMAARLRERRAVPLLVAHLRDPDTAVEDLPAVAAALGAIGDDSAREPLTDYLWLYHCEADEEPFARALAAIAAAIVALGGPAGRETVEEILSAPFTSATARAQITAALRAPAPAQ